MIAASHTDEVVTPDGKFTTEDAKQEIIATVVRQRMEALKAGAAKH